MSSFNKVILLGNVGAAPEVRSTTDGTRVASLSLATSESWTDGQGQKREKTEWHRLVAFNGKTKKLADVIERYVKKGDRLMISGKIEYSRWDDKDGNTRYSTEIRVAELTLITTKAESERRAARAGADDQEPS